MKEFNHAIFSEIRAELGLIWAAHKVHGLDGKMRLFTASAQSPFKSRQTDFEFWFGPKEINEAMELIELHYNSGNIPNSPLLLDPVVYAVQFGEAPRALGSGVFWCNGLLPDDAQISDEALERLRGVNVFVSPTAHGDNPRGGFKALVFAKELLQPTLKKEGCEVIYVEGCDELLALAYAGIPQLSPYYLLSGLTYRTTFGEYQHETFNAIFGPSGVPAHKFINSYQIKMERIKDAVKCWQAYGHNNILYRRFGVDVGNLERNLKTLSDADLILETVRAEFALIWAAHKRVGLKGEMRLYSMPTQDPWRAHHPGIEHWFSETQESLTAALQFIKLEYNGGNLPNTPLLLDPFVYEKQADGTRKPIGTGIMWATALAMGVDAITPEATERLHRIGAFAAKIQRGARDTAGLKIFAFADSALAPLPPSAPGQPPEVPGNRALYDLVDCQAEIYRQYYMVSGFEYLTIHGSYQQPHFNSMFSTADAELNAENIGQYMVPLKRVQDAATCWEAYDRHHSLYRRFGVDVENLENNLRFYNLCARDFELLDSTGPARASADEKFEMLVEGWVPRGAITLIAATGGTGKSSLAHYLCVLSAIDWAPGETPPLWLGSPLNTEFCKGICVYFSGEDGPAIVNARAAMFDPTSRAKRLMFQRTDFGVNKKGEPASLDEFLERLSKMPDVPIMVIDPARKYLEGDEDNAEVVSNFFEAIEEFAIRKNTAMLVVHHLAKGAKPKDTKEVLDCLRGSQVFIDRPRVVIGMLREGPYTIAGLAKNNIPPSLGMVQGERVFVREPGSLQLLWVPGEKGIRRDTLTEEQLEQLKTEVGV